MNYKLVFIINAVVLVAFGLLLFLAPTIGLKQLHMDAQKAVVYLTRVVGVALASLGALLWFCQNADEDVQRWLGIAALAGAVLGMIVTLMGITGSGAVVRQNGWIALIVELLFAVAYAFLVFLQPRMQQ